MKTERTRVVDGEIQIWKSLTDIQKEELICRYQQSFKDTFGYIPNIEDYYCTLELYADALKYSVVHKIDCFEKPVSKFLVNKEQNVNDFTEEQWNRYLKPLYAEYRREFGHIPKLNDFAYTRKVYIGTIVCAIQEKKDLFGNGV